jgi:hypothetical protein
VNGAALELFDRLRLREPLAQAFNALGIEGEQGWRAAARLKALLIIQSRAATSETSAMKEQVSSAQKLEAAAAALTSEATSISRSVPPPHVKDRSAEPTDTIIPLDLWQDPDVRWLTGFNEPEGHAYIVREPYEELLWWLSLPEILALVNLAAPGRSAGSILNDRIRQSLSVVEKAGYRVDTLMNKQREPAESAVPPSAATFKEIAVGSKPGEGSSSPAPADLEPQEPVAEKPAGSGNPEGSPEDY